MIKLKDSLEPKEVASKGKSKGSAPAVAGQTTAPPAVAGKGKARHKQPNQRQGLTMNQKPLDSDIWMYEGTNYKGSHFPLAAYTGNTGRRSEERYIARSKRAKKQPWTQPQ